MKKTPSAREDNNYNNNIDNNNSNDDGMYYPEDEEDYVPSCTPLPNEEELTQPFVIDQLFEFDAPQYFDFDEFDNPDYQQQYFNIQMNPLTGAITTTKRLLNDIDWFLIEHPELEPLDEVDFSYESTSRESIDRSPRSHVSDTSSSTFSTPPNNYRTPPHNTPDAARAMSPLVFKTPQRRHIATPLSPSLAKLGKAVRVVSASPLAALTPSGLASPLRRPLTGSGIVPPSPMRVTLTSFTETKIQPITAPLPPNDVVPPSPKPAASSIVPPSPKQSTLITAQPRRIVRTSPTSVECSVSTKPVTRVNTSAVRVAKEDRPVNRVGAVTKVTVRTTQPRTPAPSSVNASASGTNADVLKEVTRMLAEHNKKIRDQHRSQVLERAKKPSVRQVKQFASGTTVAGTNNTSGERMRSKSTSPVL